MSLLNKRNPQKEAYKLAEPDILRAVGRRIRAEREALGVTPARLAASVGCRLSTLYAIEIGGQVSVTMVYAIAKALGVPAAHLFPEVP